MFSQFRQTISHSVQTANGKCMHTFYSITISETGKNRSFTLMPTGRNLWYPLARRLLT